MTNFNIEENKKINFNIKVAERIKKSLKVGQKKVVAMEEYAGSGKDFCKACESVGLSIVMCGYSVVVQR